MFEKAKHFIHSIHHGCKKVLDKPETGLCKVCLDTEEEPLVELFGVKVCEGCYHDLLNHMGYRSYDDLFDCDKQQLQRFLNLLAKTVK